VIVHHRIRMYTKLKSKFKTLYWTFFHNELANTNYIADTVSYKHNNYYYYYY